MDFDRIVNGNAYELIKEVPDRSVDLIYTDIPYDMTFNKDNSYKDFRGDNAEAVRTVSSSIDYSIIREFIRVMKKPYCYIWCSVSQFRPILDAMYEAMPRLSVKCLAWEKTGCLSMNLHQYRSDLEYCLVFTDGQGIFPGVSTECCIPESRLYESPTNVSENHAYGHPTVKPEKMVMEHIRISSRAGGGCA